MLPGKSRIVCGFNTLWRNFESSKYFTMPEGTINFFNESKAFGFITPSNGGKDVFVHSSDLMDNVREGDKVSFEIEDSPKGPSAVKVRRL